MILTLRNHNDEIIQFLYGEDGYDSSKLEKQNIDDFLNLLLLLLNIIIIILIFLNIILYHLFIIQIT